MEEPINKKELLINAILEQTKKYTREQIVSILEVKEQKILELVLSQTNLEKEEAKQMLEENDYNSIIVIKKHFGIKEKIKEDKNVNTNQQVYKEIRSYMDIAAKKYRLTKAIQERKEEFLQFLREREEMEKEIRDKELIDEGKNVNTLLTIKEDESE